MTATLRDVLEQQAASADLRPPDLDGIVAAGDRRRRRRRVRVLTGAAVATALVLGGVAVLGHGRGTADVATGGGLADPVTWSRGSSIHVGPDRIDAGVVVHGFVRTSAGFVLMDAGQDVWSLTDGSRARVGEVGAQRRLVADRSGTLAAWVDSRDRLVVLDQRTGRTRSYTSPVRSADGGAVLAMDGPTVYWRNGTGVVAVDTATGGQRHVADASLQLFDAKSSVLAFADATRDLKVGTSPTSATTMVAWSLDTHGGDVPVTLSPSGRWLAVARLRVSGSGEDQQIDSRLNVYDVRTHEAVSLDLPGGPWVAVPSVWLGEATLQVMGLFGNPPFQDDTADPALFRCTLPAGTCAKGVPVGRVGPGTSLGTLPDGDWSSDQ